MQTPSASDLLQVWEQGVDRPPWYRALLLLAAAMPDTQVDDLAAFSVGQRNIYLFALRERMLGPALHAFVRCPACAESIEFDVSVRDLCPFEQIDQAAPESSMAVEGFEVRFRVLTTQDLASVANIRDVAVARAALIHRSLLWVRQGSVEIDVGQAPPEVAAAIADRLSEQDVYADICLALDCPTCRHGWSALFDIATFFWTELATQIHLILDEVHTLARAYGWRESDILALSPFRRQTYLDMVRG